MRAENPALVTDVFESIGAQVYCAQVWVNTEFLTISHGLPKVDCKGELCSMAAASPFCSLLVLRQIVVQSVYVKINTCWGKGWGRAEVMKR